MVVRADDSCLKRLERLATHDLQLVAQACESSANLSKVFILAEVPIALLAAVVKTAYLKQLWLAKTDCFCISNFVQLDLMPRVALLEVHEATTNCASFKDNGKK